MDNDDEGLGNYRKSKDANRGRSRMNDSINKNSDNEVDLPSLDSIEQPQDKKLGDLSQNHSRRGALRYGQTQAEGSSRRNQRQQLSQQDESRKGIKNSKTERMDAGQRQSRKDRLNETVEFNVKGENYNQNQQVTEFDDNESQGSQVHFQQLTQDEQLRNNKKRKELAIRTSHRGNRDIDSNNEQQDTEGNLPNEDQQIRPRHKRGMSNPVSSSQKIKMEQQAKQNKLAKKLEHGLNWEPEFSDQKTLNQRAIEMVRSDEYLNKVKMIKAGNQQIKSMEFIMDGIKIELPYLGVKLTQGYLRKETQSVNILLKREFQTKFCMLDLTKFLFKYAKAPTENYTYIHLKDIIDVYIEPDPGIQQPKKSKSVFSTKSAKKEENMGFNFQIKTSTRVYRMQAQTKTEQIMWLRALTILFELRARVSQNLKTTIDINHHLYDYSADDPSHGGSLSSGISLEYMAHQQRAKQKTTVQNKFAQKQMVHKKRLQNERASLNNSQKEIDDVSIESPDIDQIQLGNKKSKVPTKKGRQEQSTARKNKGDEEMNYSSKEDVLKGSRQNRFQKSTPAANDPDDGLEDYPDMTAKKAQANSEVNTSTTRMKSQLLEAKQKEIERRIEANKRLMEKTKQLNELQRDFDLSSVAIKKDFQNNQKDTTADILKQIEKQKDLLSEAARQKESKINDLMKMKTQAIDLKSSQLLKPAKNPQDEDEYYDEEEEYDDEEEIKSPVKSPVKMKPKEQKLLNELDDMMAPQRMDTEEPEIRSPVNQEKNLNSFVEKLITRQEANKALPQSVTAKAQPGHLGTFEFKRESQVVSSDLTRDRVKMSQTSSVNEALNEAKFAAQRNEPTRMSGQELLRQFKHTGPGALQASQRSYNPLSQSGIFEMNKKKLKIIRNPMKSPSPGRPVQSSRNQVPLKTADPQQRMYAPVLSAAASQHFDKEPVDQFDLLSQQTGYGAAPSNGPRPKLKIKTIRLSQNAKSIIRQAKQSQNQSVLITSNNSRPSVMSESVAAGAGDAGGREKGHQKNGGESRLNLTHTMVEVLSPQVEADDDDGLGAWAGRIGMQNKIQQQNQRQTTHSQIISFYDNFDKEKEKSIFDDNLKDNSMVLQDIDGDDDIQIQDLGKSKEFKSVHKSPFTGKSFNDFLCDDVPEITSPKNNIIKDKKHTLPPAEKEQSARKKDAVKKTKDFQQILSREAGPSALDKITKSSSICKTNGANPSNPFEIANESNTFEQKTPYQDTKSERSNGNAQPYSRHSWINNTRGRESFVDDTRSEKEKMKDRQNSRKRNMLENSHHLHLSSSRKSITMQGQSSITHSVTREKEPGPHEQSAPAQNRRSLRPPSGNRRGRQQNDEPVMFNDSSPTEQFAQPQIGKNFILPKQMNKQSINLKLGAQYQNDDLPGSHKPYANKESDYFNSNTTQQYEDHSSSGKDGGSTSQNQQHRTSIVSIENSNNTIVEQQNFDNRTQTNTTHVSKQVVNNYYILNVNSQASIDHESQAKGAGNGSKGMGRQESSPKVANDRFKSSGIKPAQELEEFDYDW